MRLLSSFTAGYELVTPPASSVTEGTVSGVPVTASQLGGVPLFASLDEQELAETASWFEERSVAEGVDLVGEGASGYCFFVIEEGGAVVTANGNELRELGPGDFFGEIAILGDGRRSATVTTTAPARLFVLFGTEFRRLQQDEPEIAARLEARDERALLAGFRQRWTLNQVPPGPV